MGGINTAPLKELVLGCRNLQSCELSSIIHYLPITLEYLCLGWIEIDLKCLECLKILDTHENLEEIEIGNCKVQNPEIFNIVVAFLQQMVQSSGKYWTFKRVCSSRDMPYTITNVSDR